MTEKNPFINKASHTKTSNTKNDVAYENNPFFVAINGVELLFKKAKSVAIAMLVVALLSFLGSIPSSSIPSFSSPHSRDATPTVSEDQNAGPQPVNTRMNDEAQPNNNKVISWLNSIPPTVWVVLGALVLLAVVIGLAISFVLQGVIDYTAAQLARGHDVTLSQAFSGLFASFWGYVWVQTLAGIKTMLWTLLFIVPGIVMSYRYSLCGLSYFDKKLKGDAAIKDSLALTKGAWLTTYASTALPSLLTAGTFIPLTTPGTRAILYRQFNTLTKTGQPKPKAHIVAWLTLILPIVGWVLLIGLLFAIIMALVTYGK